MTDNHDTNTNSKQIQALIAQEIHSNGPMPFATYMERVLYMPELGYYVSTLPKLGREGDFTTAPEISALFPRSLARQCQQVLVNGKNDILELGAGSGIMAATLLLELEALNVLPEKYYIYDISQTLRQRQKARILQLAPHLFNRVHWLDNIESLQLNGIIIANEVIDAFPVHLFKHEKSQLKEGYVHLVENQFALLWDHPQTKLHAYLKELNLTFADTYQSECNLNVLNWLEQLSQVLISGLLLIIDYGFPRREYYHPDRKQGTLMCHYRHYGHTDPFAHIGEQDMTAHVDFTAVAEAGLNAGFQLAGYTNQASFLLACGITQFLAETNDQHHYSVIANQVKILTSPNDMGELFKVIALTKEIDYLPLGFSLSNKCEHL